MKISILNSDDYLLDTEKWQIFSLKTNRYLKGSISNNHIRVIINNKQVLLHKVIYEAFNGTIPDGYIVHHKDKNPLNNNIDNLCLLTNSEHSKLHHKGKKLAIETKRKISKSRIGVATTLGKKMDEKTKKKISITKQGKANLHIRKPIYMYNSKMELIKEYAFIDETKKDGFSPSAVSCCCNGKLKHHKGMIFKFK